MLANNDVKVPLEKVYEFLVKKRLVSDRQGGIKLLNIQIGLNNLGTKGHLSCDEFNRIFCKGMFKMALQNTLSKFTDKPK